MTSSWSKTRRYHCKNVRYFHRKSEKSRVFYWNTDGIFHWVSLRGCYRWVTRYWLINILFDLFWCKACGDCCVNQHRLAVGPTVQLTQPIESVRPVHRPHYSSRSFSTKILRTATTQQPWTLLFPSNAFLNLLFVDHVQRAIVVVGFMELQNVGMFQRVPQRHLLLQVCKDGGRPFFSEKPKQHEKYSNSRADMHLKDINISR